MSVLEKNKIDGIGQNKDKSKVALMIADHLDWENEVQHLTILQDKINAYISFIESKQVYEVYPEANSVEGFIFELRFKYKPTENCKKLLSVFQKKTEHLRIEFNICES